MQGRDYDSAVDDGLNMVVVDIFRTATVIHVQNQYAVCGSECNMEYCLVVNEEFIDVVEEVIESQPSAIEEDWEDYLETQDVTPAGTVEIEINYFGAAVSVPADSFFGNAWTLALISAGTSILCCCFIMLSFRVYSNEKLDKKLSMLEMHDLKQNHLPCEEAPGTVKSVIDDVGLEEKNAFVSVEDLNDFELGERVESRPEGEPGEHVQDNHEGLRPPTDVHVIHVKSNKHLRIDRDSNHSTSSLIFSNPSNKAKSSAEGEGRVDKPIIASQQYTADHKFNIPLPEYSLTPTT